jgi:hypothetical protein
METEEQQLKKVKRNNLQEAEDEGGSLLIPPDISRISQPGRLLILDQKSPASLSPVDSASPHTSLHFPHPSAR